MEARFVRNEIRVAAASAAARLALVVLSTVARRPFGTTTTSAIVQLDAAWRLAILVLLRPTAGILQTAIADAGLAWRTVERTVVHWAVELADGQLSLKLDKLWLNGRRVDALIVKELLHLFGNLHVVVQVATANVRRGDDAVARQLPHVKLVNGEDAVNVFQ